MARFDNGWIKVYRKAWDSDLSDNVTLWALWHALLSMATWRENKILWNGKQRTLAPGSVVFGFHELAIKFECSPNTIKKWANYLHDTGRIVLETCARGSLATICNWDIYQNQDSEECTNHASDLHDNCTPTANQLHLSEEHKKEERKKEDAFDFESLYKKYPLKKGKKRGLEICKSQIKTEDAFKKLSEALDRYKSHLVANKTEPRFIKQFSTFMGSWTDWLDDDAGQVDLDNAQSSGKRAMTEAEAMAKADEIKQRQLNLIANRSSGGAIERT